MAEFQEVMRQWRSMCYFYWNDVEGCPPECPMAYNETCNRVRHLETGTYEVERTEIEVMSWAAEHPEPVYPRWI